MARKGISKQQIFKVAKEIVAAGALPTATKIRTILRTGSMSTIQRHLQAWKKNCFKYANLNENIINIDNQKNNNEILAKLRILEQTLNKKCTQNEHYAQELIQAEKTNIFLQEENNQLQKQLQAVQLELNELKNINSYLDQITTEIKNKLENNDNKTIQNLQYNIETLKAELKKLNETCLETLRETSTKGHEALMQEKVASINLQAKIDSLTKELIESKKQLHEAIMTAQVQIRSLSRQNEQLQKIIREHDLGKIPILDQELSLDLTKEVTVYGK